MEEATQEQRAAITFNLASDQPSVSVLDEEREKHRRRAEKFGTQYVDPATRRRDPVLSLEAKKERLQREGFATGIDLFTEEEAEKRRSRAARFGIPEDQQPLQYKPDEDQAKRAQRAKKFGTTYQPKEQVLMDMDLFEERKEIGRDVERVPEAVYLYGVDVMSTTDCLKYFDGYGPTFVEWINDSACNVHFKDPGSVKRALAALGRPLPEEEMPGQESSAGLDLADPANMPFLWHRGVDFTKPGIAPVHLIMRMSSVLDHKDHMAPRRTRELWKQQVGPNKSRRRNNYSAGQGGAGRQARDADVGMDVDQEENGQPGGGRRQRRRKQRRAGANGEMEVVVEEDVDMEDHEEGQEGGQRQGGAVPEGGDLRAMLHSRRGGQQGPEGDAGGLDMGPPSELRASFAQAAAAAEPAATEGAAADQDVALE